MTRTVLACAVICVLSAVTACNFELDQGHCPFPESAEQIDYAHPERYVEQGPATVLHGALERAADRLHGVAVAKSALQSMPEMVDQVIHEHVRFERNSDLVLQRDAGEVWRSGSASGCHDMANVAAALLRSLGRPALFVETVHDSYLEGKSLHGHVFLEVQLSNGDWMLYDPTNSRFWYDWTAGAMDLPGGYHVMGRYHDPWEAGLGSSRDLLACMDASKAALDPQE